MKSRTLIALVVIVVILVMRLHVRGQDEGAQQPVSDPLALFERLIGGQWHPGERQFKGFFTAIDMPVVFLDYTTRFEGAKMVNDLR